MPNLQRRFFRLVTKHVFGAKLGRIFRSIPDLRNMMEQAGKHQYLPPRTEIWPVLVNGVPAEGVPISYTHPASWAAPGNLGRTCGSFLD